jgi:hypothetical protein
LRRSHEEPMKSLSVEKLNYGNIVVYIVEDHSVALLAWGEIRRQRSSAPYLITLDRHIDTRTAFVAEFNRDCDPWGPESTDNPTEASLVYAAKHLKDVIYTNPEALEAVVKRLEHDEHIDAAVRLNIIDSAFVISYATRDTLQAMLECRIVEIGSSCYTGCSPTRHNEDCTRPHRDQAIETIYLQEKVDEISELSNDMNIPDPLKGPYILDIDLDYFSTERAIAPSDPSLFYQLIANAQSITIATEPECVKRGRLEGEAITSEFLLEELKAHIRLAVRA